MSDLRGRCANTEFCADAVSQRLIILPDGTKFACPKCGEPLQPADAASKRRRSKVAIVLQIGVVLLGGGALAYKLTHKASPDIALATVAAASERAVQPGSPVPVMAPAAPAPTAVAQPAGGADPGKLPATVLLRLAGSDVIGSRLAPRLAASYLTLVGGTSIAVSPSGADGVMEVSGQQAGQRDVITIASNSSAAGFSMLLRGTADVVMSASRIPDAEVERLSSLGDMTNPSNESVIAIQGVAAVVSPANRTAALTLPQLRAIFSGRVTDWSELGAAPAPIRVYIAEGRGGIVPQEVGIGQDGITALATRVAGEAQVLAGIMADRGGIGLLPSSGTGAAKVLAVGDTGATAVLPTQLSISTEAYPLTRRLYLYTPPASTNAFARRFAEYVFSPAGQASVEAAGFVPLTVRAEAVAISEATPDRVRQALAGATRISIDFRFQAGARELDSRSVRDLDRLVAYFRAQRISANRLILAGFSDSNGTPQANQLVSQQRADAVAAALTRAGVQPGRVLAFGADGPVADNASPDGRERNRRVEVYLAP